MNPERTFSDWTDLISGEAASILLLEDTPDWQAELARDLANRGHRVVGASNLEGALALLSSFPVELILVSESLTGVDPQVLVDQLGRKNGAQVVVLTAPEAVESGIRPARQPGVHYCPRPEFATGKRTPISLPAGN